ncbi:MotA/TolQ/ExbB proton channel family protein [Taibaiella lutea]|uniref:MotA/TolQ/ExbB proton channel family protein n=1 Tax=Taibaiella lutea TaxID=2608001 RepID=A0A5M6CNX2_9BACT|nr:MotA/TolQ/ExbB proton channel family protein [Taibaiella lutea]KAA5536787.1 MotA/TolQ/ExbB proton channel family protein [Taibaiella lutea]
MADVKTATAARPAGAPRAAGKPKNSNSFWLNLAIVAVCIAAGWIIRIFVLGDKANFNEAGHPINWKGQMYSGGVIVPFLIAMFLTMLAFVIERGMTIMKAKGKVNGGEFVRKVQYHLANKNVDAALAECDKQSGSVGNVMKAGLHKYKEMIGNTELTTDQKVMSIQNEIEEATALELPMLEKNLVFLSTITSAATLLGLMGTVVGMIRAFASMGEGGGADSTALAAGISEALFNTALGIGTSFLAMIAYNFYTTVIDGVNYSIDESGFTLSQSFAATYK